MTGSDFAMHHEEGSFYWRGSGSLGPLPFPRLFLLIISSLRELLSNRHHFSTLLPMPCCLHHAHTSYCQRMTQADVINFQICFFLASVLPRTNLHRGRKIRRSCPPFDTLEDYTTTTSFKISRTGTITKKSI